MKHGLNAYLATLGDRAGVKTLADIIAFNERHWAREMPLFGQQHFIAAEAMGPLTEPSYREALAEMWRVSRDDGIDARLRRHQLDALVAITRSPPELIAANEVDDPLFDGRRPSGGSPGWAAIAGYPSVSVPAGELAGLPVGLSFFAGAWTEPKLLALAADFEARTRLRRQPEFRPTAGGR